MGRVVDTVLIQCRRVSSPEDSKIAALLGIILMCMCARLAVASPMQVDTSEAVQIALIPDGGMVPDIAIDSQGIVHLVYGKGMDAYYTQSADGGKTFQKPVRLNTRVGTVTVGGERGPKIALGSAGAVHVVWQGHYEKDGGIWVTRSTDNGKSFAPERNVLDAKTGIDEPTVAADSQGNVFVVWLDGRLPETAGNKVASPIFMARSTDNGATFSPNLALKTDFIGRGCSCCMLWARVVGPQLYVAFRSGYQNIRDMYLLQGPKNANVFDAARISVDNWKLEGCPMSGPRFSVLPVYVIKSQNAPAPRPQRIFLAAWMSDGNVYWTHSEDSGTSFAPRIPSPSTQRANYPMILANGSGKIMLLWTEALHIHWAIYEERDATRIVPTLLKTGDAGEAGGRPSAFIRPDGTFVIVR